MSFPLPTRNRLWKKNWSWSDPWINSLQTGEIVEPQACADIKKGGLCKSAFFIRESHYLTSSKSTSVTLSLEPEALFEEALAPALF